MGKLVLSVDLHNVGVLFLCWACRNKVHGPMPKRLMFVTITKIMSCIFFDYLYWK